MKTETQNTYKIGEIPEEKWLVISCPKFMGLLSGAYNAGISRDGEITLQYEDGTREQAIFPLEEAQRLADSCLNDTGYAGWMDLVGAVQKKARQQGNT